MIQISLIYNREILNFAIQDRIIKYTDRKWGKWIQCIPKDKDFLMKVKMSRGKFPHFLIKMFELSYREQEEYNNAKTDEELADIIILDGKRKGCKLLKRETINLPSVQPETVEPEKQTDLLNQEETKKDGN